MRGAFDAAALATEALGELRDLTEGSKDDPQDRDRPAARVHLSRMASRRFDVKAACPRLHAAVCQLVGGEENLREPLAGFHNCVARPMVVVTVPTQPADNND